MNRDDTEIRRIFVLTHTGREDAREVARQFCRALHAHGLGVRLLKDEAEDLDLELGAHPVEAAGSQQVQLETAAACLRQSFWIGHSCFP